MRNKHLKLQKFTFDIDLEKVYLIADLGPCFKTKGWDYYVPIYGEYEAIEYIITSEIILDLNNTNEEILTFYRREFLKQVNKINSKITVVDFKIQRTDLERFNLI